MSFSLYGYVMSVFFYPQLVMQEIRENRLTEFKKSRLDPFLG